MYILNLNIPVAQVDLTPMEDCYISDIKDWDWIASVIITAFAEIPSPQASLAVNDNVEYEPKHPVHNHHKVVNSDPFISEPEVIPLRWLLKVQNFI
jgi:hypothetical protein